MSQPSQAAQMAAEEIWQTAKWYSRTKGDPDIAAIIDRHLAPLVEALEQIQNQCIAMMRILPTNTSHYENLREFKREIEEALAAWQREEEG